MSAENKCILPQRWVTEWIAALRCLSSEQWGSDVCDSTCRLMVWSPPPGLLLMVGLMLYPAGWSSEKVKSYCGPDASAFLPSQCSIGWAFYAAIGGTLASFLCAVLSAQAEIATSSDKVQEEIEEGKSLICLLWVFKDSSNLKDSEKRGFSEWSRPISW